jgi:hypothetical protein
MPFSTTDRDAIRDLFGYTWDENAWISAMLSDAIANHGESVVTYVRERLDLIQVFQPSSVEDAPKTGGIASEINVYQEVSIKIDTVSEQNENRGKLQRLKNEITAATSITQNGTPLLRS